MGHTRLRLLRSAFAARLLCLMNNACCLPLGIYSTLRGLMRGGHGGGRRFLCRLRRSSYGIIGDFPTDNAGQTTLQKAGRSGCGGVALIVLILTLILAWNYIKLLFEAAERYVLLGVLVYTAPVAFATGASQSTANIFKSWCRMFGGQIFLLLMNAWCLRLFITMVGTFISNPLSM